MNRDWKTDKWTETGRQTKGLRLLHRQMDRDWQTDKWTVPGRLTNEQRLEDRQMDRLEDRQNRQWLVDWQMNRDWKADKWTMIGWQTNGQRLVDKQTGSQVSMHQGRQAGTETGDLKQSERTAQVTWQLSLPSDIPPFSAERPRPGPPHKLAFDWIGWWPADPARPSLAAHRWTQCTLKPPATTSHYWKQRTLKPLSTFTVLTHHSVWPKARGTTKHS